MIKESKNRAIAIVWLVIMTSLLATALILFREQLFLSVVPFIWSVSIVAGLCLYEAITLLTVGKQISTSRPQQVVNLYMLLKGIKIILFLFTIAIYIFVVKVELKRFVLVAVVIYFIYLLFDTLYLTNRERKLKKQ